MLLLLMALPSAAMAAEATPSVVATPPSSGSEPVNCSEFDAQAPALGATATPAIAKVEGGRKLSYALPGGNGEYMTVNEPPAGFEPLAASDEELREWGFPPRPSTNPAKAEWRELVGGYQQAYTGPGCHQTKRAHAYLGEKTTGNENWSGYVDSASSPTKWHAVIGTFYQPYDHGSCKTNARVASWVGIGGFSSNGGGGFIQTGTEASVGGGFSAWVEIWAGEYNFAYEIPGFPIEAGNYIRLYAGYNKSLEISYFYITNDHTGQTVLTEWHIGRQYYNGNSAEWIDEAPYGSTGQYPLLNFSEVDWYSDTTQNGANEVLPIDAAGYWKLAPWHENNHRTSWPGSIWNDQNYTDFFYTCK